MSKSRLFAILFACVAVLQSAQPAFADSLPPATVNGNLIVQSNSGNGLYVATQATRSAFNNTAAASGCVTQNPPFAATVCASSSASWYLAGGDGGLFMGVSTGPAVFTGAGYVSAAANGLVTLEWDVEVVGQENISVPIDFTANTGVTFVNTQGAGTATATFNGSSGSATYAACAGNETLLCTSTLADALGSSGETTVDLTANTTGGNAVLQVQCVVSGASCSAFADPMFQIDPSFTQSGYSLEFSPDLGGPVTATPEPSSLSLLGVGLLSAGLLCRFGRHHASSPFANLSSGNASCDAQRP